MRTYSRALILLDVDICSAPPNSEMRDVRFLAMPECYCLYYFTSHFHFVYIFFHCCAVCTNICHCLLAHVFNPESEYSTSQLLTSDSRYSLLHICSIHKLLTSDSSSLLSCLSLTQPCSNVLHTFTHAPRIRLWAPASRRVTNIILIHNVWHHSNLS